MAFSTDQVTDAITSHPRFTKRTFKGIAAELGYETGTPADFGSIADAVVAAVQSGDVTVKPRTGKPALYTVPE